MTDLDKIVAQIDQEWSDYRGLYRDNYGYNSAWQDNEINYANQCVKEAWEKIPAFISENDNCSIEDAIDCIADDYKNKREEDMTRYLALNLSYRALTGKFEFEQAEAA